MPRARCTGRGAFSAHLTASMLRRASAADSRRSLLVAGPLRCRRRSAAAGHGCSTMAIVRRRWASARQSRRTVLAPAPAQPRALAGAGGARARWCVRSIDWEPDGRDNGPEFKFLLSLLNEPSERASVEDFTYWEDKRRALIARLLARKACASALGLDSFRDVRIARTRGGKPFLSEPPSAPEHPNFNFSISHEGDFVVLASEPTCLCGIDVGAPREKRDNMDGEHAFRGSFEDFESLFAGDLTERELADAHAAGAGAMPACFDHFLRVWACKEAVAKATGTGVLAGQTGTPGLTRSLDLEAGGFGPGACEPVVRFRGEVARGARSWRLMQEPLPDGHWLTVAKGPVQCVVDADGLFSARLRRKQFSAAEWRELLSEPAPAFQHLPVAALVPADRWQAYLRAAGAGR